MFPFDFQSIYSVFQNALVLFHTAGAVFGFQTFFASHAGYSSLFNFLDAFSDMLIALIVLKTSLLHSLLFFFYSDHQST